MRASSNMLISLLFLLLTTFTAAWPWPRWLPELDSLVVRQNDNGDSPNSPSPTPTSPPEKTNSPANTKDGSITPAPTPTDSGDSSSSGSNSKTGSNTGKSSSKSGSKSKSSATKTRSTSYDARLPAGGVAMITPAVIEGEQFYKIGDFVTFAWNYTSLLATPSAINIMASCSANDQLYTLAMNQTIGNATGAVTWDTGSYQATAVSDPLLTETYTLVIYDAASSVSATAQAGYLAVYDQFTFGMYSPQPYVPLSEYKCATCSAAMGDVELRAMGMVLGMGLLTVLSFTWFVGGTGVIW